MHRRFGAGQILPVAPAECCRACISDRLHPISACEDLNRCSGHGVCALGMCECSQGWAGLTAASGCVLVLACSLVQVEDSTGFLEQTQLDIRSHQASEPETEAKYGIQQS